ncbi:TRAP transporter small permease [Roseovarius sp.]|uniref:TRAP transporter small permease n=1 Tax=Roseovarius sp. TaxID=1486281 RepID=UPI003A9736E6
MATLFSTIDKAILLLGNACLVIACGTLAFMAVFGSADVISTFLFGRPVPLARELSEVLLAVVIFQSFAVAARDDRHVKVDLFLQFFGSRLLGWLRLAAMAGAGAVFLLLAVQSAELAQASFSENELAMASIRFPVWPAKIAVSLAMFITVAEYARQIVHAYLNLALPATVAEEA